MGRGRVFVFGEGKKIVGREICIVGLVCQRHVVWRCRRNKCADVDLR
jgi:hypothetical protein